jgi:multidrug efflux pump subunit AcrB
MGGWIDALSDRYERALGASLRHARWMIVIALMLVGAGVVATPTCRRVLPERAFVHFAARRTALTETDRQLHIVEEDLRPDTGDHGHVAAPWRRAQLFTHRIAAT